MIDEKRLIILENFEMPQLQRTRTIRIYLPKDYFESDKKYPVFYMHDGQNLFYPQGSWSGESWKVGEALDDAFDKGINEGIILVGIDNSNLREGLGRLDEYSPWPKNFMEGKIKETWRSEEKFGGEGDEYTEFLVHTLKNYIDNNFRTKPERESNYIGGSSMGGLISLYVALKYQKLFSKVAVVSPAFWFAYEDLKEYITNCDIVKKPYIYMDMGTEESSDHENPDFPQIYLHSVNSIVMELEAKNIEIDFEIFEGHEHSERAWAMRFPDIIKRFSEVSE